MKTQTFIYNYGFFNSALKLFHKCNEIDSNSYLLNCKHQKDPEFQETERIKKFDNIFYSGQWNESLKLFNADIMIIICSDITIDNVDVFYNKLLRFYNKHKTKAGIYAPNAFWTPWTYNPNLLNDLGDGCKEVIGTDSMIWSLDRSIVEKIGPIDLQVNKIGWGIELLAAFFAKNMNKYTVRDYSITVNHPRSSSYNRSTADLEFKKMIMNLNERKEFWEYYHSRDQYGFGWNGNYKYVPKIKYL